ncbi:MAG TPA: hypothetical protein VEQ58_07975, partial [Polyangiaceae bacterium]|nr:hypothetical protein [Polyangiaceae bacterium]
MTSLPRALGRWKAQLSLFPAESATELGRLVQRLAPAVDGLFQAQPEPSGEIDGFDGIANRGSYERLLASEWMLQRGAPLEFLRRAVSGEHSFLQLAKRRPATPESTLVLLDSGPDQLGDCRLAQLALLVLLIERAESQRHDLRWQLLQNYGEGLHAGLDEAQVRAFLKGRTGARSSAATLGAWQAQSQGRRLWLVGPKSLIDAASGTFARISLAERLAVDARALDVVMTSGSQTRRVELALPEPAVSARLLRDPF